MAKKDKHPAVTISIEQRNKMRNLQLCLALLLIAQAVAIVLISGPQTTPITWNYVATDTLASEANGHAVMATAARHLVDISLSWVVAKFLLIFAAVYALGATLWRAKYEAWLEHGVNKLRWLALGVGGGVIVVAAAMLGGVSDVAQLWGMFGLVALAGLLATAMELLGPERRLRRLLGAGAVSALALTVLWFVASGVSRSKFDGSLPVVAYYIYATITVAMLAAGTALYLRLQGRGKWADTLYTERMFLVLGFVAATLVAWQIAAGVLIG